MVHPSERGSNYFKRGFNDIIKHTMVYLDYAATSPLLPEVIKAMHEAEQKYFANASALHTPGHLSMNKIEETRELLAKLINADLDEIIFTSGASESNNTVIRTFENHEIITSPLLICTPIMRLGICC